MALKQGQRVTNRAVELFDRTYTEARSNVEFYKRFDDFGDKLLQPIFVDIEKGESYPSLFTLKGIQAKINSERRNIEMALKLNVITNDKAEQKRKALNAVQRGLNRFYENGKELGFFR